MTQVAFPFYNRLSWANWTMKNLSLLLTNVYFSTTLEVQRPSEDQTDQERYISLLC